jgi:hypothetical protein
VLMAELWERLDALARIPWPGPPGDPYKDHLNPQGTSHARRKMRRLPRTDGAILTHHDAATRPGSFATPDHQNWAVSMADHRVTNAAHQRSPHSPEPSAAHHDQARSYILGNVGDRLGRPPPLQVGACGDRPGVFDLVYLLEETSCASRS